MDLYSDFYIRTVDARIGAVVKAEHGQQRRTETEFLYELRSGLARGID